MLHLLLRYGWIGIVGAAVAGVVAAGLAGDVVAGVVAAGAILVATPVAAAEVDAFVRPNRKRSQAPPGESDH